MEDALAQIVSLIRYKPKLSLNPCCNGRCTRTKPTKVQLTTSSSVLILVVMEDALAPQNLGYALFKRIVRLDCAS